VSSFGFWLRVEHGFFFFDHGGGRNLTDTAFGHGLRTTGSVFENIAAILKFRFAGGGGASAVIEGNDEVVRAATEERKTKQQRQKEVLHNWLLHKFKRRVDQRIFSTGDIKHFGDMILPRDVNQFRFNAGFLQRRLELPRLRG